MRETTTLNDPLLDSLNDAQQQAVRHIDGPLLVLAGPGSGKTRVVTHRIAHLLQSGASGSQILALTFTNKAAEEMRLRVEQLTPGASVWVSTFHRFGARLLRQYAEFVGLTPNFTIYDTGDAKQTLKRVIEAGRLKTAHYTPDRIAAAISAAKNKLITADRYEPRVGSPLSHIVADVYPAYQQRLLASSAVDFDDLLLHVAELLHKNSDVRAELDARFRYVMVDEYQDTNRAQYVMLRALSVDYPNLAATGDPDQSIYGWRGADISNILQFESDFPNVRVVRLEQNYRSTTSVLRAADQLIRCNLKRKQKSLFTENGAGRPVQLVQFATHEDEARGIAESIAQQVASGARRPRDFAIFYRVNALSRTLERALRAAGVPFQMIRGQEFYQRKEIKDVLAYCQLLNNPRDDQALLRTINTPPRGIGKKTIERLFSHAYVQGLTLLEAAREAPQIDRLAGRTSKKVTQYVAMIERLDRLAAGDVEEIIGAILTETGYQEHLEGSESEEDLNRLANIQELLTDARQFDEQYPGGAQLEAYLENAWLVNETDNWETDSDKATMMTLHAAKGLEFPVVYMVAVEHGLLPHERSSVDPDQLEEERRLAFVGITRAKEELQLSYAVHRDFRGQRRRTVPSSFLLEMPRSEMELHEVGGGYPSDWDVLDDCTEDWSELSFVDASGEPPDSPEEPTAAEVSATTPAARLESNSASAPITTAADLAGDVRQRVPAVPPEVFRQGMTVVHPDHGPGKIVAISGAGKGRRATVQFAAAGERRFILAHSPLRPTGR